jgi:hypothetical protein
VSIKRSSVAGPDPGTDPGSRIPDPKHIFLRY